MKLSIKEKKILGEFKRRIKKKYSDEIQDILVFGSKARGNAGKESDIDILVITSSGDWKKGDEIRGIGYGLDEAIGYKLSIQVISKSHIDYLRRYNFQFIKNVEREAVSL